MASIFESSLTNLDLKFQRSKCPQLLWERLDLQAGDKLKMQDNKLEKKKKNPEQ